MKSVFCIVGILAVAGPVGEAAAAKKGEVNYLDLAALLARDGNYERAEISLRQVDQDDDEFDSARFHLVRGIIGLNRGLYTQAVDDFRKSVSETERRQMQDEKAEGVAPVVFVYLGQALFYSQDYAGALQALEKAGMKADEIASTFALRAESLWKLERRNESWAMLNRGMARHPEYTELLRRKLYYAIELKLYRVAAELGEVYLVRSDAGYEDYLALGEALNRSGSSEAGLKFLELARLRAPSEPAPGVELARAYQAKQQYRTAGAIMEHVALMGASDAFIEAAELYRLSGENLHAMALNGFIVDSQARLRQRLAIALDMRSYALVTAMGKDLRRTGLIRSDESIRYAVAYAHFKEGDFEETKRLLSGISSAELFRKATALRDAMNRCADTPWSC